MLFKNYPHLIANGSTPALSQKRKDVLDMLAAGIEAVDPYLAVEQMIKENHLAGASESFDLSTFDHLYVIGFGKASVGMAQAVCDLLPVTKGVIVTNDSSHPPIQGPIEVIVGGHPVPTQESVRGATKILDLLKESNENDCVIILLSGGGSSICCLPRVPLIDLQGTIEVLLRSGARIDEINTVRRHLSFIKGGQLASFIKGVGISLVLSDVIGDSLSSIASGPTAPDPTTFLDAKKVLEKYNIWVKIPMSVQKIITDGCTGQIPETLKEGEAVFQRMYHFIVGNNVCACKAVEKKARELGYLVKLLTTSLTGEASHLGPYLVSRAQQSVFTKKVVFLTAGEPTVTLQGDGIGGRNQELVLSCLSSIADSDMVVASCATDGIDGNSPSAGALADGNSLARAHIKDMSPSSFLKKNNSYEFFKELDDALLTGPTGTNVMDIQIVVP